MACQVGTVEDAREVIGRSTEKSTIHERDECEERCILELKNDTER